MRYAIVESGGKQFRAVEGETLEVDRLPGEEGMQIAIDRILFMADDADFMIGAPTVSGIEVKATVVDHFSGRKVTHFKYSPKKRIRVRGGHRQKYTRLMVDFIGRPGEVRKVVRAEPKQDAPKTEPKSISKKQDRAVVQEGAKKLTEKKSPEKKAGKSGKTPAGSRSKPANKK
jgi:large subunit ribosomal protein L21